jgi:hypothetical protein
LAAVKRNNIEFSLDFQAPDDFDPVRLFDQIKSRIGRLVQIGLMELEGSIEPGHDPFFDQHMNMLDVMKNDYAQRRPAADEMVAIAPQVARYLREQFPQESIGPHPGFQRLAIDAEAAGDFRRAIELCQQALDQGWEGDWERRIKRYTTAWRKRADQGGATASSAPAVIP